MLGEGEGDKINRVMSHEFSCVIFMHDFFFILFIESGGVTDGVGLLVDYVYVCLRV